MKIKCRKRTAIKEGNNAAFKRCQSNKNSVEKNFPWFLSSCRDLLLNEKRQTMKKEIQKKKKRIRKIKDLNDWDRKMRQRISSSQQRLDELIAVGQVVEDDNGNSERGWGGVHPVYKR